MTPGIGSWILLSSALFCIGLAGVMLRRNPLVILLSLEIMLNAGNLLLVAGSRYVGGNDGQVLALTVMAVAAAEVVVGLGLIVALAPQGLAARRRRAAEPARMNAADYGWLVLLAPLVGLAFNIARRARASRAARSRWVGVALGARGLRLLGARASSTCSTRDDSQRAIVSTGWHWLSGGGFQRRREHPRRPALGRDAARRHRRGLPDPRVLDRLHARRPRGAALLRVPQSLRVLDAAARAGRELRVPARRLGPRRPLVLPADRLLVAAPDARSRRPRRRSS